MNFLLIAVCLFSGWLLRFYGSVPKNAHEGINAWILFVALPAVAFKYIPTITWGAELLLPILMPVIVWIGAWLVFSFTPAGKRNDPATRGVLILTAGLGNTSFVGFPLTQAYFGDAGLRIAVVCDQMTFVLLSTVGVVTAMHAAHNGSAAFSIIAKRLVRFPPFLAFIAALLVPHVVDLSPIKPLLDVLAMTLVPLALFSVGLQLRLSEWKSEIESLSVGLGYKMVVAPALVTIAALIFSAKGIAAQTGIFEASMAPMITSAILAQQYNLNPRLANLMASVGILVSLLTTFGWWYIIQRLI
jgi:malate permease and related proteins